MFQQYQQLQVNQRIPLYEGEFRVRAGDLCIEANGLVRLRWLPRPGIEFVMETDAPCGSVLKSLTVELPGCRRKVDALGTHQGLTPSGRTAIRASARKVEWGGEQPLLSAEFQVVNFSDFITPGLAAVPGDPTAIAGDNRTEQRPSEVPTTGGPSRSIQSLTSQTVMLRHDGWQVSLVALPESRDRYEQLKATGGYAFTHVGQLTRIDASAFSVEQAKGILESLWVFLSFARGAACGLPIQWGRGSDGEIVWRWFGSPDVDGWERKYLSWSSRSHGEILAELFDPFCRKHRDPKMRESLVVALHWYRHCNTNSSGPEGSLVLGMAALELLGALVVVDRNGSMLVERYNGLSGAAKLRKLLKALKLQPDIPQRYEALSRFAKNNNWDSCQALAKLRNGFVHANEKNRRTVFGSDGKAATLDAWLLSLWYQELALLQLLEHCGSYRNRTTATLVNQVEPVPWSKS